MAKKKINRVQQAVNITIFLLLLVVIGFGLWGTVRVLLTHRADSGQDNSISLEEPDVTVTTAAETTTTTTTTAVTYPAAATRTTDTVTVDDTELLIARNALLVRVSDDGNTVLAERDADAEFYPASMTKIMSMLTFFRLCGDAAINDAVVMDGAVIAAQQAKQLSVAGFKAGEPCRIQDLLYAMMLCSGADAAVTLASYAAGSEEAFVAEMNAYAQEMGLAHTHFTNCTGLHNEAHYSNAQDFARILCFALQDPVCRELMSTRAYTTAVTPEHDKGISFHSTTLTRMVGDELEGLSVPLHIQGGKTGYTDPAGQCLASWAEDADGQIYICIIAGSTMREPLDAVGDTLTLYQLTAMPLDQIARITVDEADLPDYFHY